MTKEEEITRNLTLIEYYKEQLNALDTQSQYIQAALADYQKGKITIEQVKRIKEDSEILIPVGGGTFITGTVKNPNKVLMDIGAGYISEKTIEEGIKKIDERIKRVQESQERLLSQAQKLQIEANELSEKTQKLMNEARK
jgi:prefoldin alpha subunit